MKTHTPAASFAPDTPYPHSRWGAPPPRLTSTSASTSRSVSASVRSSRSGTSLRTRNRMNGTGTGTASNVGSCSGSNTCRSKTSGPPPSRTSHDFVAAVVEGRGTGAEVGMCFCDLRTSEVILSQLADSQTYVRTMQKLSLYSPTEILVPASSVDPVNSKLIRIIKENLPDSTITPVARRLFNDTVGLQYIRKYIIQEGSASLLLGIPTKYFCLSATAAVMRHIEENRNATFLNNSVLFKYHICKEFMVMDCATAKNLELTVNLSSQNDKETLFGIMNETMTPMGARLLRSNILQPLTDQRTINTRLDCVQELSQTEETFYALKASLKAFTDIDRLITAFIQIPTKPSVKHSEQSINHIINLKHTLRSITILAEPLGACHNRLLKTIHRLLTDDRIEKFMRLIDNVIEQNAALERTPIGLRNQRCFAVKAGCNGLLDVARQTFKETINDTLEVVNQYVEEYNISLKVEFSTTMGYYLSTMVDRIADGELPLIFINIVKKNKALTFTTLELVKKNAKINDSLTDVYLMSDKIVSDLSSKIRAEIGVLYKFSEAIAMLDMLLSFAHLCTVSDYVRPEFADALVIKSGRHPIIEKLYSTPFVPNDTYVAPASTFQIITGPNMSGKSTYLRQVALLTIMAQIGSFVPAEFASFRIMEQMFSRIGSDESIEQNTSSFMWEMKETAYIMQNVNQKSLVIIDELGRGTSTHDGLGIAYAVCEELVHSRAYVFFATHFQELTCSLTVYPNAVNLHLQTETAQGDRDASRIIYKYRLTEGPEKEEHYGLSLAKSLKLPGNIAKRAEQVSFNLENLQEKARRQTESDKVIARRRALAEIAYDVVLIQRSSKGLSQQEETLALRDAQQRAIARMLAIRDQGQE